MHPYSYSCSMLTLCNQFLKVFLLINEGVIRMDDIRIKSRTGDRALPSFTQNLCDARLIHWSTIWVSLEKKKSFKILVFFG